MKPYTRYCAIKNESKVVGYQFIIQISDIPWLYKLEFKKKEAELQSFCFKNDLSYNSLVLYKSLEEDRRHNKTIPKGYRMFRFMYTPSSNVVKRYHEQVEEWF